jgi:hypothetical protein
MDPRHVDFWKQVQDPTTVHMIDWKSIYCVEYPADETFLCASDWSLVTCEFCKLSPDYDDWLKEGGEDAPMSPR